MRRISPIVLGILAAYLGMGGGLASAKATRAKSANPSPERRGRNPRTRLASWGLFGRSSCTPRIAPCVPLCRRGPEVVRPQPCGPMLMVIAPTVLTPEVPAQPPAEEASTASVTPTITLTAASTAYEWNPTSAGATSGTTGPLLPPAPMGNANIPVLGNHGAFGGLVEGSGSPARGLASDLLAYDYYHGPNNFGGGSFASSLGAGTEAVASLPGTTRAGTGTAASRPGTTYRFEPPSNPDPGPSPGGPVIAPAAVPEPASILATLTGLGLFAASASRLRPRRGVDSSSRGHAGRTSAGGPGAIRAGL